MPGFKLGLRFGDPGMVKTFLKVGRTGIDFAVLDEGVVTSGDLIEQVADGANRVSPAEMLALMLDKEPDPATPRRRLEVPALVAEWRQAFETRSRLDLRELRSREDRAEPDELGRHRRDHAGQVESRAAGCR